MFGVACCLGSVVYNHAGILLLAHIGWDMFECGYLGSGKSA